MSATPKGREAILKERARRLAERGMARPSAEAEGGRDWLLFGRGGRVFGLETGYVAEAQLLGELLPIPCTPSFILGVATVRGRVVAVTDLPLFLGLEAGPATDAPAMIILRGDKLETALLADAVLGVESLPAGQVLPAPTNLPPSLAALCRGVTARGWLLLDARALLDDPGLAVEERV